MEKCTKTKIEQGIRRIEKLLDAARIPASAIKLCLATGGMVNMPCIQSELRQIFGAQRVEVAARGNTIISEGAAWIAHDKARLMLSKNIEVLVARQAYFSVIQAGTLMPNEGTIQSKLLDMYCVDPTDGVAKFQIVAPERPGKSVQSTDDRKTLGTLSVRVNEKAMPLSERLCLDLFIDDNLILNVEAKSTLGFDGDKIEIHELEFGLATPLDTKNIDDAITDSKSEKFECSMYERGAVMLRTNLSEDSKDVLRVPGEVARQMFGIQYFDRNSNRNFSTLQDQEKLNYQPCSACRQIRCICATLRSIGWTAPR